ncbi:MAG: glycosyltransferase family 4 protein [Lentisphaeria bacterium]|nr:glycosyltransferase family 4 protein [Lentisphaeria bacterium]
MSSKKKILICSAVFPPEPVVSAILSKDLAEELSLDYDVTVLAPKPTRPYGFTFPETPLEPHKYDLITVDSYTSPKSKFTGRFIESYSFGKACAAYLKKHKNDIRLIYLNVWPLCAQYIMVKAANKYNIPVILHIQDIYPESLLKKMPMAWLRSLANRMLLPLDQKIQQLADHVIVISENMRSHLKATRNLPDSKMTTVINWQNEQDFLNCPCPEKSPNSSFTFMYLGNIGPVARVDWLIDCFGKANLPDARFVIAGSGSQKEKCKEKAKNYLSAKIEFWDVPAGKVPEIQSQADVMVLSLSAGAAMSSIPSKIPAYMFSGKPILGALDLQSDTAKAILNSQGGIVVSPDDTNEFIEKLRDFAKKSQIELNEFGKNSLAYGLKYFSRSHNLNNLISVMKDLYHANK